MNQIEAMGGWVVGKTGERKAAYPTSDLFNKYGDGASGSVKRLIARYLMFGSRLTALDASCRPFAAVQRPYSFQLKGYSDNSMGSLCQLIIQGQDLTRQSFGDRLPSNCASCHPLQTDHPPSRKT